MANLVRSGVTESEVGVGGHSHGQNPVRGGSPPANGAARAAWVNNLAEHVAHAGQP